MFDDPKRKVPCFKCLKGHMQKLLEYSDRHVLMRCTHCGKIDEIAIIVSDGKTTMTSIVQEWDEPVERAFDEMMSNTVLSLRSLKAWKEANATKTQELHAAISGWNEFENLYYLMIDIDDKRQPIIKGVPWQYLMLEADRELKASLSLAAQGYTKVAYKSLRSFLELSLFGMSVGGSKEKFDAWFEGGKTPSFNGDGGILETVTSNKKFTPLELIAWKNEVKEVYRILSGYVHTQGKEYSSLWLWNNAHLRFDASTWEGWVDLAVKTVRLVGLLLVTAMPTSMMPFDVLRVEAFDAPTGLFVDFKQNQIIEDMFDGRYLKIARDIASKDEQAIAFIDTVKNSRSLSDEDINKSMEKFLASIKKNGNYTAELKGIEASPSFQGTVKWTVLFGFQKKVERDIGLTAIANTLNLVH